MSRRSALAVAMVVILTCLATSGCVTRIQFPAASKYSTSTLTLIGNLSRPGEGGRRPAVVLLAPCGGVTQHMNDWAGWLIGQGYVTLIVDSFSARGSSNACRGESPTVPEVATDALAALSHLATLPFVDSGRVAAMGWSHGGGASLAAARLGRFAGGSDFPTFRAVVAFYPPCQFLDVETQTPTLILLAGRDDWTPTGRCMTAGSGVTWKIYPNAYHAFDQPGAMRTYLGHVLAFDGSATSASQREVREFLARELQGKP